MKKKKYSNKAGKLNNYGFSLVELIISIAILVIIMTPLMNNFFRAQLINNKAEDLQVQSNLAANIMEGLKANEIKDIVEQFNGDTSSFSIIDLPTNPVPDVMRLEKNAANEFIESSDTDKQATYYFAINGMEVGGTAYDAFIEMNALTYINVTNTMNDYAMPNVINLDEKTNGLLQSKIGTSDSNPDITSDTDALASFLQMGEAYAEREFYTSVEYLNYLSNLDQWSNNCETAQMLLSPTPAPPSPAVVFDKNDYPEFCNSANVIKRISKKMIIDVSQNVAGQIEIKYVIEYYCNWKDTADTNSYDGETTISYPVSVKNYLTSIDNVFSNVYLFYAPSIFSLSYIGAPVDKVQINSDTPINFFAAKQVIGDPSIKIFRSSNIISVYKNSSNATIGDTYGDSNVQANIFKSEKEDRIFSVTVNICKFVPGAPKDKYQKVLHQLKSSTE